MKKTISFLFSMYMAVLAVNAQTTWTAIKNFGGHERAEAVAFTINNLGYVGLGDSNLIHFKDIYQYNPTGNTWTKKADFGGLARTSATAFAIGANAYVGLGSGYDGGDWTKFSDFWKYNSVLDSWTQLNYFPYYVYGWQGVTSFVIDTNAYMLLPDQDTNFFKYNLSSDTWEYRANCPIKELRNAVGFTIDSMGYICTGNDDDKYYNDLWEYDPAQDKWTKKASFPGGPRNRATGFSIGKYGFVGTGCDMWNSAKDFWCYVSENDSWIKVNDYPAGVGSGLSSFVIGNTAYAGIGYLEPVPLFGTNSAKFYKYSPSIIAVSTDTINMTALQANKKDFNIFSNINWNASSSQTWLTMNKASGTNNDSITITADSNTTNSLRSAVITISGTGATSQTIIVNQAKAKVPISTDLSETSVSVYPNPANEYITISANENLIKAEITDLSGRVIHSEIIAGKNEIIIDLSSIPSIVRT